jgi:hypothetical protein
MNDNLIGIILIIGLPVVATIIETMFEDDKPSYKEKYKRINRNESDCILDRND